MHWRGCLQGSLGPESLRSGLMVRARPDLGVWEPLVASYGCGCVVDARAGQRVVMVVGAP
jgi:hypothetical protein